MEIKRGGGNEENGTNPNRVDLKEQRWTWEKRLCPKVFFIFFIIIIIFKIFIGSQPEIDAKPKLRRHCTETPRQ